MITKRSFRILIIADLLLIAAGIVVAFISEASLPEPLREWVATHMDFEGDITVKEWISIGLVIPLIIAMVVSYIGLLMFWRPARPLYLATVIVGTLITPLFGPFVSTGWSYAMESVSMMVTGVILALLYFSPVGEWFNRRKQVD